MKEKLRLDATHPSMRLHHPAPGVLFYSIDDIFECMKSSRRGAPKSLMFEACGSLTALDEISRFPLRICPTNLRVVYSPDIDDGLPCYEFEGLVVGDYPEKIWVNGILYTGIEGQLEEGHVIRLAKSKEAGTTPTPNGWM
ncbi:hypothetical protein [Streptomyces sp. RKAG293]|uniref:hypothetical protein n=1 Tax=Streptomyces sp. RKAG293 TaxID=2893403 RepID=UPI00203371C2|nr:hypothetical protein [Streptomyces sp. RKAG293]MCM2417682.1 hypothetical protein [Streptomyces sp. RKAG293]